MSMSSACKKVQSGLYTYQQSGRANQPHKVVALRNFDGLLDAHGGATFAVDAVLAAFVGRSLNAEIIAEEDGIWEVLVMYRSVR